MGIGRSTSGRIFGIPPDRNARLSILDAANYDFAGNFRS